jgi:hypothetical protein
MRYAGSGEKEFNRSDESNGRPWAWGRTRVHKEQDHRWGGEDPRSTQRRPFQFRVFCYAPRRALWSGVLARTKAASLEACITSGCVASLATAKEIPQPCGFAADRRTLGSGGPIRSDRRDSVERKALLAPPAYVALSSSGRAPRMICLEALFWLTRLVTFDTRTAESYQGGRGRTGRCEARKQSAATGSCVYTRRHASKT